MPALSVALPMFNSRRTIRAAVSSVLQQTFDDFELIVLDDGSNDGTREVLDGIRDPRLRLHADTQRRGLAHRLNQAIDMARGSLFARMDADDICFPERFATQVAFLRARPNVDLLASRALVFRDDGSMVGTLPCAREHGDICRRPWAGFPLAHPTWMGRTEWFRRHRYREPEVYRAEDQELLLRSYRSSRFACLEDVLLAYRQGPFDLRRTLRARRSLLRAFAVSFAERGEFGSLALHAGLAAAKAAVDLVTAVPGLEHLFFVRMARPVPQEVRERWHELFPRFASG